MSRNSGVFSLAIRSLFALRRLAFAISATPIRTSVTSCVRARGAAYIDEFNRQQAFLENKASPQTQPERMVFATDSLAESVLRGLSGQIDAENVGDKLVTIDTVLQVVGTIQKVPASGPQLEAALNAFQQALEKSCDADELEKQRRRSLKARNAARAHWDRVHLGGVE